MKKREPKADPINDIILNDKELEILIRQVVKKAHQKGTCITWLNKAVSTIWKEEFPVKKEEYKLTEKEEAFAKKVENFLKHYEQALVSWHDKKITNKRLVIGEGASQRRTFFFNKCYQILCAMYAVFEREDKIGITNITTFARKHFNSTFAISKEEIDILYSFMYFVLYFDNTDELPEYSERKIMSKHRIREVQEFLKFEQQYESSCRRIYDTSIAAIWLIQKYF